MKKLEGRCGEVRRRTGPKLLLSKVRKGSSPSTQMWPSGMRTSVSGYGGRVWTVSSATATTRLTIIFRLSTGSLGGMLAETSAGEKGAPEGDDVAFLDGLARVESESVKENDVGRCGGVWVERGLAGNGGG